MKQSIKLILWAAAFAGLILVAFLGYRYLSDRYQPKDSTDRTASLSEKKTAPDFTVQNEEGEAVHLSDYSGKPVIINFWATWCGPCELELPYFDDAYQKYGDEITFLMINLTDGYRDTVENVKQYVEDNGYHFPVYFDTDYIAAEAYSTYSIPLTVVISKDGSISKSHIGTLNKNVLEEYVSLLLKE